MPEPDLNNNHNPMPDKRQVILVIGPDLKKDEEAVKELQKNWDKSLPPLVIITSPKNAKKAINKALDESIENGYQPALMILGHGGADRYFDHGIGLAAGEWWATHDKTSDVLKNFEQRYYSDYQKAWQQRHPGIDPKEMPKADSKVESCSSEVTYCNLSPEVAKRLNIIVSDSKTEVSYGGNTAHEVLSFARGNAENAYLEDLIRSNYKGISHYNINSVSTSKGVVDGDKQLSLAKQTIKEQGFEKTIQAALNNIDANIPDYLRAEARERIEGLKPGDIENKNNQRLLNLVIYLAEPEKRYTPVSDYAEFNKDMKVLSESKDKKELAEAASHLDNNIAAYALEYFTQVKGYGRDRSLAINALLDTKPDVSGKYKLRTEAEDVMQLDVLKYFMDTTTEVSGVTKVKLLEYALTNNNQAYAKYMFDKGHVSEDIAKDAMIKVAETGNLSAIKFMEAHTGINVVGDYEQNLLHITLGAPKGPGKIEAIEYLASKIDVNAQDQGGFTALHIAARNNDVGSFKKLVELGANIHQESGFAENLLKYALESEAPDIVTYMKQSNVKFDIDKVFASYSDDRGITLQESYYNLLETARYFERDIKINYETGTVTVGDRVIESKLNAEKIKELKENDINSLIKDATNSNPDDPKEQQRVDKKIDYIELSNIIASAEAQNLKGLEIIQNKGDKDEIKIGGTTYKITLDESIRGFKRE